MKYKVQTYLDVATSAETMQVLNFSVGGKTLKDRCMHLFQAYKFYKLGKISIKFCPASTLPVDPLGLSYDDEDPLTVDPRDQLDCGLVRITNGEDIFDDLTGLSEEQMAGMYQAMLLDPHWYKFGLQSGFKRTAVPLYWQVGQLHQDYYPGSVLNIPRARAGSLSLVDTAAVHLVGATSDTSGNVAAIADAGASDPRGLFQVGHRGRMGYLPTDAFQPVPDVQGGTSQIVDRALIASIPEVRVITAILPKMRKTLYYYRVYITEEIFFSGLRHFGPAVGTPGGWYGGIDQFIRPKFVDASVPTTSIPPVQNVNPLPNNDGADE